MRSIPLFTVVVTGLLAGLVSPAWAECGPVDSEALRWLDRMSHSLRETSYRGVFTYQHGGSIQAMRITHSVKNNIESEQITRLSGAPAQVQRTEHPLDCIHPGHRLVRIGEVFQGAAGSCGLSAYYRLKMAGVKRIAERRAVLLNVMPRDMYRYGYQLALDTETGLLLKTQTMSLDGKRVLERFQFADLEIGDVELAGTHVDVLHEAAHSHGEPAPAPEGAASWGVRWLPGGFMLTDGRGVSAHNKTFTDGLAVFTVFLEPAPQQLQPGEGQAREGGTTAYTRGLLIEGKPALVTVLGEVPINTARRVADSVAWANPDVN
ncbi:MAG: MucB/RseB C-terminal domain-containing protein [Halieaceae bacterium]